MFKLPKWLKRGKKSGIFSSPELARFFGLNGATWSGDSYNILAREGYVKNIVAYHCITRIAQAVADIPFCVSVNGKEVDDAPILTLLKRPNPKQSYKTFLKELVIYRLISGNSYIHANTVYTGRVMELTNLRPDRIFIRTTSFNVPIAYDYTMNGFVTSYPIDPFTFESEVLHIKETNPLDDLYGLSPIRAAAMSIDQHNESGEWNKKLLENSARPPGVLVIKSSDTLAPLTQEQVVQLSDTINTKFAGSRNAGKIPVLNADMMWQSMGMSPTDMDWINGKNTSARDICLAFGYPALLLGMPEGSTFSNVSEAKLALYEETVIPLLNSILDELAFHISVNTKQEITLYPDLDQISALSPRREKLRSNARDDMNAGVISPNEARIEIGYDPVPGGDELLVPAGKLPINFNMSDISKSQYEGLLKAQGFDDSFIKQMVYEGYEKV